MLASGELLLKANEEREFSILKSDGLVIGGYASIEIVDKQNDLITLDALDEAVKKYMGEKKYRNVMSNHSNVQVGEVVEKYRDKNGVLHKTSVDDVGFYVVIKMRDDIEKAKEISRNIRKGTLRSFSIGGQAISKKQRTSDEYGEYNEIDKLELHEVTICEKGINPEAKFDILKQESEVKNNMSEKLEKALEEDTTREYEAGEEVVSGGSPKATPAPLTVSKGLESSDFSTLDLSAENVEKAYEAFKAEQLEKLAYDNLSKTFGARVQEELALKKSAAERSEYDARADVADLKAEFAELRKSLTEKDEEIRKAQEVAFDLPENFPTSVEEASGLSWGDIHNLARGD